MKLPLHFSGKLFAARYPGSTFSVGVNGDFYFPDELNITESDLLACVDIESVLAAKIAEINADYAAALDAGITVGEVTLLADAEFQATVGAGLTMINSGLLAGLITTSTNVSTIFGRMVSDKNGNEFDMTASQYIALCMAYGAAIGALQANRNAKIKAAQTATTIQQIESVAW